MAKKRLGELLVRRGVLTRDQLDQVSEALQKEKVSDSLENKIRKAIKDREDIMVIKVKFLIELAETNPKLKKEMEMDTLLDKLADLVTTTEATKIVASLL